MPIVIVEDKWEQTESYVIVYLSLKNATKKTLDVLSTPKYVKVSHSTSIFEKYLFAEVDEEKTVVEVSPSTVTLRLLKKFPCSWLELRHPNGGCRKTMREARQEALEFERQRLKKECTQRKEVKREKELLSVQEHIENQSSNVKHVSNVKETEKRKAIQSLELEQWNSGERAVEEMERNFSEYSPEHLPLDAEQFSHLDSDNYDTECRTGVSAAVYADAEIDELLGLIAAVGEKRYVKSTHGKHSGNIPASDVCPVRAGSTISFTATSRIFPTPQRESQTQQEEEWLKKQTAFRRVLDEDESDSNDLHSLVLRDPLWIKCKGDKFLDAGDWESATSCYTYAIQDGAQLPGIFLNRGLCHLKKNNLHKVLEDMSKALDLLQPAVPANAKDRVKAHWSRAVAFAFMGLYTESLIEYAGARKIDCENGNLQHQENFVKEVAQGHDQEVRNLLWMFCGEVAQRS